MQSHAQNFEDVLLYRALKHIQKGCYIDVGAWHPQLHSVTKWFYDLGWSGVNVEPSKRYFSLLQRKRPRDVNLNIAVGASPGRIEFFEVHNTGLSSIRRDSVEVGEALGYRQHRSYEIEMRTLAQVFSEFQGGREVHFLKIDVEGLEHDVLAGTDLRNNRPWIVVVEAVRPGTNDAAWGEWEGILLENRYECVWFDGLNRFYLREESNELRKHFGVPVNLFDNFKHAHFRTLCSTISLQVGKAFDRFR